MLSTLKTYKFIASFLLLIIATLGSMLVISCSNKDNVSYLSKVDYKKAALLNVELGYNYLSQGYTDRAKKKFLHALELMPNLAEVHSGMGYFWSAVGEDKEAEKHYKKSIYLGHGKGFFYNQYAMFLCNKNNYAKADQYFMLAINDKLYTNTAEAYANAGVCSLKNDNKSKAAQYFTKSLYHDPSKIELFLELTDIALSEEKLTLAKNYLDTFYQKNSKPTAKYLWLKIKLAQASHMEDQILNDALLLKNLFNDSVEYAMYQQEYGKG